MSSSESAFYFYLTGIIVYSYTKIYIVELNKMQSFLLKNRSKIGKTAQIERDEKMRKLEFENVILRKNLPKVNGKQVCSRDISFTCSSRMMMHLKQDKNSNILRHLKFSITEFRKSNVRVNDTAFAKDVFGSVFKGCIISSNQRIAVKKVSSNCRLVDVQAECKKAMVMAGHENFYLFLVSCHHDIF